MTPRATVQKKRCGHPLDEREYLSEALWCAICGALKIRSLRWRLPRAGKRKEKG